MDHDERTAAPLLLYGRSGAARRRAHWDLTAVPRAAQQQQPQQTGIPPNIMQHMQPAFMQAHMQSQHA
jgi:hypothetical protein